MTATRRSSFLDAVLVEAERHARSIEAADDILWRRHSHRTFHIASWNISSADFASELTCLISRSSPWK